MLISQFAAATGLSRDTVRYYVRLGLLRPKTNGKGNSIPYRVFTAEDVQAARIIQLSQSFGMSLKTIAAIGKERREGRITRQRSIEILTAQLDALTTKELEIKALIAYLQDKIAWVREGSRGEPPVLEGASAGSAALRRP
jgi:DNA-binding transcriptional MerR regulator